MVVLKRTTNLGFLAALSGIHPSIILATRAKSDL
jgi:hypothetical protein